MYIHFTELDIPVSAAISERKHGNMRMSAQDPWAVGRRAPFMNTAFEDWKREATVRLVHGNQIEVVGEATRERVEFINRDGLITNVPGTVLTVNAADCPTLFLYDPIKKVVGIAHCGWKGLHAGIVSHILRTMRRAYDTNPSDILAAIGPGIGPCHFEVGPEVAELFGWPTNAKTFLNLPIIITKQLKKLGVLGGNIVSDNAECTYCAMDGDQPKYFSYRRDKSDPLETMMSGIMLRPGE